MTADPKVADHVRRRFDIDKTSLTMLTPVGGVSCLVRDVEVQSIYSGENDAFNV